MAVCVGVFARCLLNNNPRCVCKSYSLRSVAQLDCVDENLKTHCTCSCFGKFSGHTADSVVLSYVDSSAQHRGIRRNMIIL